jgi:hypothetical protein
MNQLEKTLQDIGAGKYSNPDYKDPEELERFKNAPDGYPDSFKNSQEQQTSDNNTNYKRQ